MPTESERMLNVGVPVELSSFPGETLRVRELTLEQIVNLGSELVALISEMKLDGKSSTDGGMATLVKLLKQENTKVALLSVAAYTLSKQPNQLRQMGATDWLKWAKAFKEVVNWEELKELFFDVFPMSAVKDALILKQKSQSG